MFGSVETQHGIIKVIRSPKYQLLIELCQKLHARHNEWKRSYSLSQTLEYVSPHLFIILVSIFGYMWYICYKNFSPKMKTN